MSKKLMFAILLASVFSLSACAGTPYEVREGYRGQAGAVGGAVAGALIGQMIGHNSEATLIGTAVGGLLGYIVGNEMDKYDRQAITHVMEKGRSNQAMSWVNPDSLRHYAVTPRSAYSDPQTQKICRCAEIKAVIDGREETTHTTACRNINGVWELQ